MSSSAAGKVIIVGAGQAGAEASLALRRAKFAGSIVLIGGEKHLPYERPPLSKNFLTAHTDRERLFFRKEKAYETLDIRLLLDNLVEAIDIANRRVGLYDGSSLEYTSLILATGASPRRLDVSGCTLPGVIALRTLDDAAILRARLRPGGALVVIGGGYLGLEAAASARMLGSEVTVVEAAPTLLARSTSSITASSLAERHLRAGVNIRLSSSVSQIIGRERVEAVATTDGDIIAADTVLVAIGAVPDVELAERGGIECRNGILVDGFTRTDVADVHAVGDCAMHADLRFGCHVRLESIQSATWQARLAAAAIAGTLPPVAKPAYFWSEQFDAKLQVTGWADPAIPTQDICIGDRSGDFAVYRVQSGKLAAVEAVNRPADFVRAQPMIGRKDFTIPS